MATNNFDRLPVETIAAALSYIPSDDRDVWVQMAMAVKYEFGETGFSIWDSWSQGSSSYNAKDAKDVWKSVKSAGSRGTVGIGTLIQVAQSFGYEHGQRPATISDEEAKERREKREREVEAERKKTERRQHKAALDAQGMFDAATADGVEIHPYHVKKSITNPTNVRIGVYSRWFDGEVIDIPNSLLIPIRDADRNIISIQAYFPDGENPLGRDRDYMPGALKSGGFFVIGSIKPSTEIVVVCEGYATGWAVHNATGYPVVVAFDAGNLPSVAKITRTKLPDAKIIIAADNDQWGEKNAGVKKAGEAAVLSNAIVAVPQFVDTTDQPTDFDDLLRLSGANEVAKQIKHAFLPQQDVVDTTKRHFDMAKVDWYSPLVDVNDKGKPYSTIENLAEIIRRLGVTVRYNVISKEIEILIPNEGFTIDNEANASLAWLTSCCSRFKMPLGQMKEFLCYLADKNQHNPVAKWITSKPWDGTSRLKQLYNTIVAENEKNDPLVLELKEVMIKRWLISAVAAAFLPNGIAAKGVLVLQGSQNVGKTSWFKSLVPSEMRVIKDGMILKPDDRDSVKQVVSYWMVELGELDSTFRRSDISQLKAFITNSEDVLRRAFAPLESRYPRRTVFFASVNPKQFLHDTTGNIRYWTIPCASINQNHNLDMQQIWAEVYEAYYLKGEKWYLLPEEMHALNDTNQGHEVLDPIKERLLTKYDWSGNPDNWRWLTATEIMQEIGFDKPSTAEVTRCGQVIADINGKRQKRSNGKNLSAIPYKSSPY